VTVPPIALFRSSRSTKSIRFAHDSVFFRETFGSLKELLVLIAVGFDQWCKAEERARIVFLTLTRVGNDFFKEMEDDWSFCSAISYLYVVKEMQERREVLAATLSSSENEDGDESEDATDLYAQSIVKHLLWNDVDREAEERADVREMKSGFRADPSN
jgi:hypothetical protein